MGGLGGRLGAIEGQLNGLVQKQGAERQPVVKNPSSCPPAPNAAKVSDVTDSIAALKAQGQRVAKLVEQASRYAP